MPSPRLLGLPGPLHLDRRDQTVESLRHNQLRDEDESAAWGMSPIETYLKGTLKLLG
jgi:hypothetical protein